MPENSPPPTSPWAPTIAVDAMGGDHAPAQVVAGAVAAAAEHRICVVLTGRPSQLRPLLGARPPAGEIRIASADDFLAMDEGALASWRRPRSSVAVACQLVRRGQAAAVVSAGSTAGIVATARLRLRSLPGLMRPGLAVALPTGPKPTLLVDAGAIADPKPEMLRAVRPARGGLRPGRLRGGRPPGGPAHDRCRAGQGQQARAPGARAAGRRTGARQHADPVRRQHRGRRPALRQRWTWW